MQKQKSIRLHNDLVAYVNEYGIIERFLDMSIPMSFEPKVLDEKKLKEYQKRVFKEFYK